jgi:hypothetical protein
MADIPLKSEEETTTDLVGAIEDIAQSVKAGSRDFSKTFGGLTTAIKKLQTTLVNAIKSIKVQVVTKPEKPVKQPAKVKETSTKEVVKEKETKTEVKPEPKAKAKKAESKKEPVVAPVEVKVESQPNSPLKEKNKEESSNEKNAENKKLADAEALILKALAGDFKTFWKKLREFSAKVKDNDVVSKALKNLVDQGKIKKDPDKSAVYSLAEKTVAPKKTKKSAEPVETKKPTEPKVPKIPKVEKPVDPEEAAEKEKKKKRTEESAELRLQTQRNALQLSALRLQNALNPTPKAPPKEKKKEVDPQEKERIVKEKAREKEIEKRQEKVRPVKISSLIEGINQTGDAWSKMISGVRKSIIESDKARKAEEQQVAKTGKEGTKDFVGPPKKLFDKNERKISDAAEQEAADEAKRRDKIDQETANAEKTLRTYFRKQEERQASQEEKAANDLIKQQEQAARELAQANQKTKRELDSLVAGFQGLSSLFKGPLVRFGLNMVAKGIGFKQPKTMSKGGDVSYLADGGTAMKPKGTDTQPAMLTPGEFVVNEPAARKPGNRKILESINSGKNQKKVEYHSSGGSVGGVGYYAAGGPVLAGAGVAIAAIGTAINSVTKSFAIASEAVSSFASAVQKANPALMEQVGLAMDDLQGVIGRALTPAITMIIPLIRQFADYVDYAAKKFAPSIESFVKVTKELLRPVLELGVTITNALMPSIKLSVLLFAGIVKILTPIIDLFSSLFESLSMLTELLGDSEFLFGVFNNSIEILSRAVSIVAGTIQLVIGAFVVGVSKMIEVLGAMIDYIPFSGDAGKSIEGFGEKVGKVGEKLYNKSIENFRAVGEGKPRRFRAGEMSGDKGLQNDSSYGAAVRQVQSFSIAGIGDEMRKNALMAGVGQKTQEESLNQIEKNTGEMVELFKNMKVPQGTGAGGIVGPKPQIQDDKWKNGSWW